MHIEGFDIHALEGTIQIARSISFVAVAAICMYWSNNCFCRSRAICIVLTICWSMSKAIYILRFNTSPRCVRQCILLQSVSEDHSTIHFDYSVCCPIVGAMIVFQYLNICVELSTIHWSTVLSIKMYFVDNMVAGSGCNIYWDIERNYVHQY